MPETVTASAFQTVSRLATQRAVHRAFQWFHLQEPKLRAWHRELAAIPAPTFQEKARAAWLAERFAEVGLEDVYIDACGNVLGWMRSERASAERTNERQCVLCSAHLDTVFPADAVGTPIQNGSRLTVPGASDNCAGITAVLAMAAAMQSAGLRPETDILFAGNVGEEGEGNLRGMRYLFSGAEGLPHIRSAVVVDGAGTETIVTRALGSVRLRVSISGPGGHSWTDAGVPNPILVLANAVSAIGRIDLPSEPRTTWNIGRMEGGTSVNAIPQQAEARIDIRSVDPVQLQTLADRIRRAFEEAVDEANSASQRKHLPLHLELEPIGERPAAHLPNDAGILEFLRTIDRHLGIQSDERVASTDANIPLSLGIEAVSIGAGGSGGGIHTLQEWFDATGRDLALKRILLLLLALTQPRA